MGYSTVVDTTAYDIGIMILWGIAYTALSSVAVLILLFLGCFPKRFQKKVLDAKVMKKSVDKYAKKGGPEEKIQALASNVDRLTGNIDVLSRRLAQQQAAQG